MSMDCLIQVCKETAYKYGISQYHWTVQQRTEMVLYLADLYLTDFDSTHCTQLPSETFEILMASARRKPTAK